MVAKFVNTAPFCRHGNEQWRIGKSILPQGRLHGFTHRVESRLIDAVSFGQRNGQLRVARQL